MAEMATSKAWETAKEGSFCANPLPPATVVVGLGFDSFRLLRGWLGYGGSRGMMTSFRWGWGRGHGGM